MGRCILYTGIGLLLLIRPFISSVSFLQFSNFKNVCHTFLRNCEAYKVDTWYTHGQWVDVSCIPQSGCCFLFVPYFFLSSVQKLKIFVTLFSGTVRSRKFKLGTLVDNGWIYLYTRIRLLPLICHFISSFFFLSNYQTLTIFVTLFSGTVRPRKWNLIYMWTMGACIVYRGIRLLLFICPFIGPFFFLSNFQLQICLSPLIAL